MTTRSYGQFCAVARALDIVGERWTLLLVRELLLGPRRFADLMQGLPGIGTSLLSARLKRLESAGVIMRRTLPPPAASMVYELTDRGRGLGPVLAGLAVWGTALLDQPTPGEVLQPQWLVLYLAAVADRTRTQGLAESYEVRLDGHTFHYLVTDGAITAHQGAAPQAALVLRTSCATLLDLVCGRRNPDSAIATGELEVQADPDVLHRALWILQPPRQIDHQETP